MQVLCTAAKLEVTPFMLFGMYSERIPVADTYSRYQVLVGNQKLSDLELPFREKMYLHTTAENYLAQIQNDGIDPLQTRVEQRYPFFTPIPKYPYVAQHIYNKSEALAQYEEWFKKKLSNATGENTGPVTILRETYSIMPYSAPVKLIQVDTLRQF